MRPLRRLLIVCGLVIVAGHCRAQKIAPPTPFTFALPDHPGRLFVDGSNFEATEFSAKPNGREFGIRAEGRGPDAQVHLLGFVFVWPEASPLTSAGCRDRMLEEEAAGAKGRVVLGKREFQSTAGAKIAVVSYRTAGAPSGFAYTSRAFLADGELCGDVSFSSTRALAESEVDALLAGASFEPLRPPDFYAQFVYAKVLEDHHALAAAAHVFELAAAHAEQTGDALKWRRVATDQASMDYGMAGDLQRSRALNQAAIAKDPEYPLYYYNLACADAEQGNAAEARVHLQQAFDWRAHVIPGEKLPDPAKDDSILKLKGDKEFWRFVQSLP